MASYHLWHPTYVSSQPLSLDVFVTRGNAFFLSRGSDALVEAVLRALGLKARAVRWSFQAVRAPYFSSHRSPGCDWEDAWQLVWRLRAELDSAPPLPPAPSWGYHDLETHDPTWRPDDLPEAWPSWPCMILADAPDLPSVARCRGIVESAFPDAAIVLGQAFERWPQLRCDLGPRAAPFYASGAAEAEALLAALAAAGSQVDYRSSLAWAADR